MNNKFYTKDERQILDFFNENLGTEHRKKPYDIKSKEDLKELVELHIAKYMDFRKYWSISANLYEEFDESMELYTPLTWASITRDDIQGDDGMLDAYSSLGIVESNLSSLYDQAQEELKELLMIIMKENEEVQNYIWNDTYHFNVEDLGSVFEQAIEAEFSYSIDESFELFCGLMKNVKNEMIENKGNYND